MRDEACAMATTNGFGPAHDNEATAVNKAFYDELETSIEEVSNPIGAPGHTWLRSTWSPWSAWSTQSTQNQNPG